MSQGRWYPDCQGVGCRVSAGLVDRFMAMIPKLRAMDDVTGDGTVLSLAEQEFGVIAELLDQASYDEPTGRQLHIALAELGQLAGWAAYDAGQQSLAQRYYVAGLRATHSADDRPLGAHILGSMAYQAAREGHPAEAVTLIDTALAGVRGRETASLLTALYSRQAYALATLRDSSGCAAAMSKTRTHVEHLNRDEDPPYLYWVGPAEVTAGAGRCLLQLGKADQAAAMLAEGITCLMSHLSVTGGITRSVTPRPSPIRARSAIWTLLQSRAWRHSIYPRTWIQLAASAVSATSTAK
jgi:hypothetical protein